ncbi:MAG: endonuclease/exonuclease/phosphatase family protein [Planctomycetales bacterium]|nr:endonuclease/exonuclease/phosphatase family protein [Planctomycetales bacterium]
MMRTLGHRASAVLWILCAGSGWLSAGHAAEPMQLPLQLRVLCYNIHYGQGTDGKYDVARLARVIQATRPDLVALQEVDVGVKRSGRVHEAQRLGELTGLAVRFGPTQHYEGGLFGNAVLTRFPIENVVIHPLPYTESTAELVTYPRGAIAVDVKLPGGRSARFISTHFQHNVPEDRLAEAKAINQLFAGEQALSTILAGDMNATPDSAPIAELLTKWTIASDQPETPTAPSGKPRSRIDYVLYRTGAPFKLLESRVVDESVASDHRPVLAVIELE